MPTQSGKQPSYRVTSAGVNPAEDRAHRMRMYFIAMTLRLACVLSLFWVKGWWVIIPAIGAVVFPWFAVMVGNAVAHGGEEEVAVPEPLELTTNAPVIESSDDGDASQLLVVDVEPVRRSERGTTGGPPGAASPGPASASERPPTEQPTTGQPPAEQPSPGQPPAEQLPADDAPVDDAATRPARTEGSE